MRERKEFGNEDYLCKALSLSFYGLKDCLRNISFALGMCSNLDLFEAFEEKPEKAATNI